MTKLEESNVISKAWKFLEENNAITYSVQFNEVPWKFKKALFEAMVNEYPQLKDLKESTNYCKTEQDVYNKNINKLVYLKKLLELS